MVFGPDAKCRWRAAIELGASTPEPFRWTQLMVACILIVEHDWCRKVDQLATAAKFSSTSTELFMVTYLPVPLSMTMMARWWQQQTFLGMSMRKSFWIVCPCFALYLQMDVQWMKQQCSRWFWNCINRFFIHRSFYDGLRYLFSVWSVLYSVNCRGWWLCMHRQAFLLVHLHSNCSLWHSGADCCHIH